MSKVEYVSKKFRSGSLVLIEKINGVFADYQRQGFSLMPRQVYYQMAARDIIPNGERSYKMLSSLISDARLAGLVDRFTIEHRTRNKQISNVGPHIHCLRQMRTSVFLRYFRAAYRMSPSMWAGSCATMFCHRALEADRFKFVLFIQESADR